MRTRAALFLVAGAFACLGLALAVLLGLGFDWQLGPIRIRITSAERPVILGVVFAVAVLFHAGLRRVAAGALVGSGVLALIMFARTADPAYAPAGDIALIESYTLHAVHRELFLGPYSRFGWNHPGPLYFFLLAPFYVMTEHRSAGLSAGALIINLTSLGLLLWACARQSAQGLLAVTVALATVVFTWSAAEMLASQWNPHVLVLPTMAIIVVGAAVAAGSLALLPVLAGLVSFVIQTHLGLGPTVLSTAGVAIALALVGRRFAGDPEPRPRIWPVLNATLWLLLALWLLPIVEELSQPEGNLSRLWMFFAVDDSEGQRFRIAFRVWADMMSALVRSEVHVGWGNRIRATPSPWSQAWAITQTLAVALILARALLARDRFRAALSALLLVASGVGLWSITRIEDDIYDHLVFWIAGIGALEVAIIADAAIGLASRGDRIPLQKQAAAACVVLWLTAAAIGFQQMRVVVSRSFRPGIEQLSSRRLADALLSQFEGKGIGRPFVKIDQPVWGVAAGVLLQLQKRGIPFGVEEGWWFMFGPPARPSGGETSTLIFAAPEMRVRLQDSVAHELLAERDRVSIFLARDQP
jgi:hypothetical protein